MTPDQIDNLRTWWIERARDEIDAMLPKLAEYGTGDLHEIGRQMAHVSDRHVDDQTAFEWGVMFYALGKIQRVLSAAQRGTVASDDTWHDLVIYAKMVQAARARRLTR